MTNEDKAVDLENRLEKIEKNLKYQNRKNWLLFFFHCFILILFLCYCDYEHSKMWDLLWDYNQALTRD